jgi:hypothetical protein
MKPVGECNYQYREFRLTDVHGNVVRERLASPAFMKTFLTQMNDSGLT